MIISEIKRSNFISQQQTYWNSFQFTVHRYMSSFITLWILTTILLFWFWMLIVLSPRSFHAVCVVKKLFWVYAKYLSFSHWCNQKCRKSADQESICTFLALCFKLKKKENLFFAYQPFQIFLAKYCPRRGLSLKDWFLLFLNYFQLCHCTLYHVSDFLLDATLGPVHLKITGQLAYWLVE